MKELNRIKNFIETTAYHNFSSIKRLAQSGSNRCYYRISDNDGHSVILTTGPDINENKTFINIGGHLKAKDINVPEIFAISKDFTMYIQEDLGDQSLFEFMEKGRDNRVFSEMEVDLLEKTIHLLARIHTTGSENFNFNLCYPVKEFDRTAIMWDLNYFKYCFLKPSGIHFSEIELEKDFEKLCNKLESIPRNVFMVRDFQSRNVMINHNEPYLIDFQGGRKGTAHYDIASFLWQAKACYPNELRRILIRKYLSDIQKYRHINTDTFEEELKYFVLIRILQTLGAYGYRGYYEKKEHFISSIPLALGNLNQLLNEDFMNEFPYLSSLLKKLIETYKLNYQEVKSSTYNKPLLNVTVTSFSYKKGLPVDNSGHGGGFIFDCRAIENPGRYEEYKIYTGLDKSVIDFLNNREDANNFYKNVESIVFPCIEKYINRNFTHLSIAFGCTGGQHRSVYFAEKLSHAISMKYDVAVIVEHREQGIKQRHSK